jgi:hypothetical protein
MKRRPYAVAVIWLAGVVVYIALSASVAHLFGFVMLQWAHNFGRVYRGTEIEILLLRWPVFVLCLLWGAHYASALAKPAAFGRTPRIVMHLGWSYLLSLLGCVLPVRIEFMPLPNFQNIFAVSTFIFAGFGFSILCFVLGLAVWIHLAFSDKHVVAKGTPESAGLQI